MHGYVHFAEFDSPMNSAMGPQKKAKGQTPNASMLSKHTLSIHKANYYFSCYHSGWKCFLSRLYQLDWLLYKPPWKC